MPLTLGDIGIPLSFFASQMSWWEQLCSSVCSCRAILPCHRPQSNRASWLWTQTSETMSQNKPFLLISWFPQIFCHGDGSLTNMVVLNNLLDNSQNILENFKFFCVFLQLTKFFFSIICLEGGKYNLSPFNFYKVNFKSKGKLNNMITQIPFACSQQLWAFFALASSLLGFFCVCVCDEPFESKVHSDTHS
jgi:hypothetical protein